jgi:hypothetical protein
VDDERQPPRSDQADAPVTLVTGFVRGTARGVQEKADAERFATAARVGPVAGEEVGAYDPARSVTFGLDRLLDGGGVLIVEPPSVSRP